MNKEKEKNIAKSKINTAAAVFFHQINQSMKNPIMVSLNYFYIVDDRIVT